MQHFGVCKKRAFGIPMPLPGLLNDKYRQAVRIMKITAFILLVCTLHVSAAGYSQSITLSEKDAPLDKIFKSIEKQTDYIFFYNVDWLNKSEKVNVEVKNMQLQQVLDLLFKNQPLKYSITGKMITVFPEKKEAVVTDQNTLTNNFLNLHGKVVDENGKPVPGVSVSVLGTKKQTITDENGEFNFHDVGMNATLSFTSVNMEPFQINVGGKTEILARLKTKTSELDEVQIIAYGQTSKRLQTGSVSTVKGEDIEKQPVGNPLLSLEGRVTGLYISQSTGISGSAVAVQIRGKNSIENGNSPFYVVDGVPYTSQLLPNLNSTLGYTATGSNAMASYGNPLSFINPADIESIEVLKDADATAIYGSRAANGAILITTKKGKIGRTQVNINLQNGWGKVNRKLDVLDTKQYLEMRHEAKTNDGAPINQFDYDINGTWDTTKHTDWQKALIGNTSQYQDAQVSVSGGNPGTQFFVGAGYHKETTVVPGNFNDQKGSVHFNLTNNSQNNRFRMSLNTDYLIDINQLPTVDLTSYALQTAPVAPDLYNSDGSLNWGLPKPGVFSSGTWTNPLAVLNSRFRGQTNNLISNLTLSYLLTQGLTLKSNFGYTNMQVNETSYVPSTYFDPYLATLVGNSLRSANYANNNISSWIIEPQLAYSKAISRGKLEAFVGVSIQQNKMKGTIIRGRGYSTDALLGDVQSAASTSFVNSNTLYKYNALFGRINYNWEDKYLVNFNARRDGSSRFGAANRFHNFWSVAPAWVFSKESFFRDKFRFLSFGKLRASYGTTGNDQIPDYQSFDLYYSGSYGVPYQNDNGLFINNLYNPFLQWEETKKLEGGLELGFLNDRVLLTVNYFKNRSSNQLLQQPLPSMTGFPNISSNFSATVQNTGFEFSLNTTNIKTAHFQWTSSINLTIPKNKLISFPGLDSSVYKYTYAIGQPISLSRPYHYAGVDPQTGLYTFSQIHGGTVFAPNEETVKDFINIAPEYYGGFFNSFDYKGFELDFLFQFTRQVGKNYLFGFLPGYPNWYNQPTTVLDRWQKQGDVATIQRFTSSTGYSVNGNSVYTSQRYATQSSLIYSDASFIRLKNVSLSWHFPQSLDQKVGLQDFSVFVHGQNLLTITHYKGLDPETQSISLPPLRVWTIGIHATLK